MDDIPRPGDEVTHCNPRTGYELIAHAYEPDGCTECGRIAGIVEQIAATEGPGR